VIFYHAGVPGFSGGYLGVDVFFVISGFLITQLLEGAAHEGRLRTLREFYLRRARRILPALYVLLAVAALVAALLYLPPDLKRFGRSLLLASIFLGNLGAALDGGYFDPGGRFAPLRHLWSIGVEEQFYLVFPLFVFAIAGLRDSVRRALIAAALVLSLALSYYASTRLPIYNYYMLPTRAWELLAGALLALSPRFLNAGGRLNQVIAALSLAALAVAFWQARVVRFPGTPALAACTASALLIASNSTSLTLVGRALSLRPLVATGLISYSLYLWHAPILCFYSYYHITDISWLTTALLLGGIYLAGYLSWRLIERPFRALPLPKTARLVPLVGLPVAVLLAGCGYWMKSPPLPIEDPVYAALDPHCLALTDVQIAAGELCSFGPQDGAAPKVLLWGDSHAYALLLAYRDLAETRRLRIYYGIRGACWPLVGSEAASSGEFWRARCAQFNTAMAAAVARLRPQRVILNAYWLDPGAATEQEFLRHAPQETADVIRGIDRTLGVAGAAGASVCAVLTVPGYPYPIPYALKMSDRRGLSTQALSIGRAQALAQYQTVDGDLRTLAGENRLRVADPKDVLCPISGCRIAAPDGTPLYRDGNHLSVAGSREIAGVLASCVTDLHP
jgi:peptidoglycan/LPS O-acetylase OafA/YrhL